MRKAIALASPLLWLAGASSSPAAVKVAGQLLIDLNYSRGITTQVVGPEEQVTAWTNFGEAGGAFVKAADSPYGPDWLNAGGTNINPPFLTANKGGAGINVPESLGGRSLVSNFATPTTLTGNKPYTIEAWLWKNDTAVDARGIFAWTENTPAVGDAGKFAAGNPAGFHNNGKDLTWGTLPTSGAWHHIALTYDGITEKVYLDGAINNSGAKTLNISSATYYPMIFSGIVNGAPTNTSTSLNGAIAALRVHSDALSAADIANNNTAGISAVPVVEISVAALAPSAVASNSATLNGNLAITSNAASTALTFYYGPSDLGRTTTGWAGSASLAAPQNPGPFSKAVTGLLADTTYYVRIRGVNSNGEGWSAPISFHTPGPPIVANLAPQLGASGTATVSATVDPNGSPSTVKLYWGPTNGGNVPANWANMVDLGVQPLGTVSSVLSGLAPSGATYYYTFFASNSLGVKYATPSKSFKTREFPSTADLLFSSITESLPDSGPAGTWPTYLPAGESLVPINTPTVKSFGGVKWAKNSGVAATGFRLQNATYPTGQFTAAIPINGASIVVPVRPLPHIGSDNWDSVVDIFYNRMVIGVRNDTGVVSVWRNGDLQFSATALPVDIVTVLSLVVQPNGDYKVYANGAEIMNITTVDPLMAMTSLNPLWNGGAASFASYMNIGRNNPDTWPTFNGYIGDVFVYKKALSDVERTALEANLTAKFVTDATLQYTISSSAGANGGITPSGSTAILQGNDQTYAISANSGFVVDNVLIDGAPVGAMTSYTFTDVSANHTISATFKSVPPQTITASAGANGSISPSGAVSVNAGTNQTFIISPNNGFKVADVLVDGVSVGVPSNYTFNFVVAPHTISVSFAALSMNIPRSGDLLFSAISDDLPADGADITVWPTYVPTGNLAPLGNPTVEVNGTLKWEKNLYVDGDGFIVGQYSQAIPVNGVTATAVIEPMVGAGTGDNWTSIIDVMYNRVVLGIRGTDGVLRIWRNGVLFDGPALQDGQRTVLSLVIQPTGELQVFANGNMVMDITDTSAMNSLDPNWNGGGTGFWSYINVGRNQPDGWTTYSGKIGDVFLYKSALNTADREQLEGVLLTKYGIVLSQVSASAGPNGTITPSGNVFVVEGSDPTFTINPNINYAVEDVLVDGVSVGPMDSYTFFGVTGNHTISATFAAADLFSDWISFYITDPEDPDAAKGANPDHDGLNNLAEYAFDGDPTSGVTNPKMRMRMEDVGGETAMVLTFPVLDSGDAFTGSPSRTLTVGGVIYTVEGTNQLGAWDQGVTEIIPARSEGMEDPFFGWSYHSFRLDGAIGGATPRGPKGFLRVRIENAVP